MNYLFLASSLWLSVLIGGANQIDLKQAIDQRTVYATFQGNSKSTHYLKPLQGELRNLTDKTVQIQVPAGYHFSSKDSTVQDIVITQDEIIVLGPKETKPIELSGMCVQHHNSSPGDDDAFKLHGYTDEGLQRMADYLNEKNIQTCQGQQAMWIIASKTDLAPLFYDNLDNNREIIDLTCEILERPALTDAQFEAYATGSGRVQTKAELRGKFSFKFSRKVPIHIALFTDQGIVLKEVYKEVAAPGRHNVEYTFDAMPYQGQTIHAKLIAFDDVIMDRVIELLDFH